MSTCVKLANYLIKLAPLIVYSIPSFLFWGEPKVPECLKNQSKYKK